MRQEVELLKSMAKMLGSFFDTHFLQPGLVALLYCLPIMGCMIAFFVILSFTPWWNK